MFHSIHFTVFILLVGLVSCKSKQDVDPVLLQALQIQDEGIHTGLAVDSMIDARIGADTSAMTIKEMNKWKERVALWREAMVAIPGVEHDHSHQGHAHHDHDHHDHSNDHGSSNLAEGMTPADIKQVQLSWKNEIEAIRDSIR